MSADTPANLKAAERLVQRSSVSPEEVIQLLEETFIGTNGAQYQLLNTRERIEELFHPNFFYLLRNQKAIGNITICDRPILINNKTTKSYYIRYFAFKALFQGGDKASSGKNKFHLYFEKLFSSSDLSLDTDSKEKSIFWAFIDPENLRSFKMREKFGFEEIGSFKTYIFQRFFPKYSSNTKLVSYDDFEFCKSKTFAHFKNYNFFSGHRLNPENYFVFEKDGQIKAGIKVFPSAWRIKALPGKNGKPLKSILPLIPFSKRLINPKHHKFLATEGFWFDDDVENSEITEFLSGILHLTNHYSIFFWEDDKSTKIKSLHLKWGMMEKIKQDNAIKIIGNFNNYSDLEIQNIINSPKYLSGFDMT